MAEIGRNRNSLRQKADRYTALTLASFALLTLVDSRTDGSLLHDIRGHFNGDTRTSAQSVDFSYSGEAKLVTDVWKLDPSYVEILRSQGKDKVKTDYMIFVVENVSQVLSMGHRVNPVVMSAIPPLENGYGKDILAGSNNFFGMKAYEGDNCVLQGVSTQESDGNSYYDDTANFMCFNTPLDSFVEHVSDITSSRQTLDHYNDAENCFYDTDLYISAIQGGVSECGGTPGEPGYASDHEYRDKLYDVIHSWGLDKVFVRNI